MPECFTIASVMNINSIIVTADQMRQIEGRIFEAGMPVPALMEKVAGLITRRFVELYPLFRYPKVGVLIGPGHNGGDALVMARELHLRGHIITGFCPFDKKKELTDCHFKYVQSLGVPISREIESLYDCDVLIDGIFGFGLTRELRGEIATTFERINQWGKPVLSIDLPSGIHTDTGEVLGVAIRASQTLCLGLWKAACFQDSALGHLGEVELVEFGIPLGDIEAVLPHPVLIQRMTREVFVESLPLPRPVVTHKYKQGHLLLICGSKRFAGAALLSGLGARASGVGMLSIAIPSSLKPILVSALPEALILDCPETETGAIAELPNIPLEDYSAIACGPGLSVEAENAVQGVLAAQSPLILDADGLNILAVSHTLAMLSQRTSPTILTPHLGEFKRLFPDIAPQNALTATQQGAEQSGTIVLLKGARTCIAAPHGSQWVISESTPALARGGSGDVLTGLMGGLIAQTTTLERPLEQRVAGAAWWHAQAGILAAQERTELGVDAFTLSQYLGRVLSH
ncbi:NAD(P)H-hydrate dehydratase [Spirulina subsalsa FACHB-351]|uniref:Bifunctional NAD(P)H-hydrate repair enzyme n=2 Tax=Spirulina subsalsa TaxID=54311 RepID=A0ABT3L6H4_9CYAN|nr:NAD(P)H-hydrate dehydratase [Spirulina subsalsa FACHB-351]